MLSVLIVVMPCLFHEAGAIEKLTILVAMPQRNLPWQVSTHYSISYIRFLYAYSNIPFILQMSLGTIANFFTSSITHFLESTSWWTICFTLPAILCGLKENWLDTQQTRVRIHDTFLFWHYFTYEQWWKKTSSHGGKTFQFQASQIGWKCSEQSLLICWKIL